MNNLLGQYIFLHGYSRWHCEDGLNSPENLEAAVSRSERMHTSRFPQLTPVIMNAFDMVRAGKVMPAMRSLQYAGPAIERNHVRIYNTWGGLIDTPARFGQAFYLLLCGSGIGFSVQPQHIMRLPCVPPARSVMPHRVEDSIEGAAQALDALVCGRYAGFRLNFDTRDIRDAGSPCRTSGGYAPGPGPIEDLALKAHAIFDRAEGRRLKSIEAYDLLCHIAEAASAGAFGRSAMLALFSPDDNEMCQAKSADWHLHAPWRRYSNNSAVLLRDKADRTQLRALLEACREWGDPGVYWTDNPDYCSNSCVEAGFDPVLTLNKCQADRLGRSPGERVTGWQGCTLSEINVNAVQDDKDLILAARAAAIINTLQAAYTDIEQILGLESRWLCERDALIGVGMTGMMDKPHIGLDYDLQTRAAQEVRRTNIEVSTIIGIRPAVRCTLIKPAGKTSLIFGGTTHGIHPRHAEDYFMRLSTKPHHPAYKYFKQHYPEIFIGEGKNERAVFALAAPANSIVRDSLNAQQFLEVVKATLAGWVRPGADQTKGGPSHNVSCTVSVHDDEWSVVEEFLWIHKELLSGIALLRHHAEVAHPLAPLQKVATRSDQELWKLLHSKTSVGGIVSGQSAIYLASESNLHRSPSIYRRQWAGTDAVPGLTHKKVGIIAAQSHVSAWCRLRRILETTTRFDGAPKFVSRVPRRSGIYNPNLVGISRPKRQPYRVWGRYSG